MASSELPPIAKDVKDKWDESSPVVSQLNKLY